MAGKSVHDDSKIMDVSKPGRGKIMTTSRPVVAPIVSQEPKPEDASTTPAAETAEPLAPSATHRVIQPLNEIKVEDSEGSAAAEPVEVKTEVPESNKAEEPVAAKPAEEAVESKPADGGESSDAAGVNALAEAAESKKLTAKKAEEQAKRDAEVQELIASRKYVVPIGHGGLHGSVHKRHQWIVIAIILLVVAIAAGYLLIDAGIVDAGFDVPFEVIK